MRIIILSSNYPRKKAPNNGVFIHQQVKALTKLGVSCEVVMPYNWYPPMGLHTLHPYWVAGYNEHQTHIEEELDGVKITSLSVFVSMPSRLFPGRFYHRAAKKVAQYLNKIGFDKKKDWVLAYFLNDSGYIAAKVKEQIGVNVAVMGRGDDIHAWPEQDATLIPDIQFVYHHANVLLANSKRLAKDAERWMKPDEHRTFKVVYNGINYKEYYTANHIEKAEIRKEFGLEKAGKYMICIARPVKEKGWQELLEALHKIKNELNGWQLIAVAPKSANPEEIDLQKLIISYDLQTHVVLMNGLAPTLLGKLLRACDALVLPSYNEGLSNALLEGMASGLVCIATNVGGHSEVIEDKSNGILIEPRSVEEIAEAISYVIANEDLRKSMGEKARTSMLAFGDYYENAKQLKSILEDYSK